MSGRTIWIIAGPNGAGKTTFAQEFLVQDADCPQFLNADLIAAGLSPFVPELAAVRAGRLMLEMIFDLARRGESFAFETTLAGRSYLRHIRHWQADGYHVTLFYLRLPSPEVAISRVAQRVRQGGHDVPEPVIRRRFAAGWKNFEERYRDAVDTWVLYDNTEERPRLIDWGERR